MPDDQHEPEPDEMEGMLGTVLKSLFGKVDETTEPSEAPADDEGSVLRVVLDRVNGRLDREDESQEDAPRAKPLRPLREEPIAPTRAPEGKPTMSDRDIEEASEEPTEEAAPEPQTTEATTTTVEPPAAEAEEEPPPAVTEAAAAAAAELAMTPPPATAAPASRRVEGPVADRLSHPDAEVRSLALEELRGRPDDVPLDAVSARLSDPDPATRRKAVEILGEIPEEAVVLQLLDAMQDPSEEVRAAARAVFERRRSDSLVRLLRQELPQPARGRAAAVLLSQLGEVDMLIRAMADADPETRALIREVLEAAGVTERLIADLSDPHPDLRLAAADRLGVMRAMRAVPDLVRRLEDPDPRVRTNAAAALGAIGESSAIQPLKQALIADPDPGVVESLVQALRRLANPQT